MRLPPSPVQLLLFLVLLVVLFVLVQIGLLHIAAEKLGIGFGQALFFLFMSLAGSVINLPLLTLPQSPDVIPPPFRGWLLGSTRPRPDRIVVAINFGGAIMPILFSLYLVSHLNPGKMAIVLSTACVSSISYFLSRPIPRLGITMPIFIPPLIAALCALIFAPTHSPAVAYISGTFGVIIGADLLHLKHIQRIGVSVVSIGGAGTFDGIFLTGIVAVLLA